MNRSLKFGLLFLVVFGWTATARVFQNSYVKFDLPDNWACHQEGAAWVCAPTNNTEAREAVIISTAKLAGPDDSLKSFDNYLRQPKTLIGKTKSSLSQPLSVDRKKVGDQDWVEAIHMGSEIPNFTTHYLATVKQKLAILVSLSADQDLRQKYEPMFTRVIQSMKVDASKPLLMQPPTPAGQNPKAVIGQAVPVQSEQPAIATDTQAQHQKKLLFFGLIALVAILVLFAVRKLV